MQTQYSEYIILRIMRNINKKMAVIEKVSITAMYSPILTDSAISFLFYEQCALGYFYMWEVLVY